MNISGLSIPTRFRVENTAGVGNFVFPINDEIPAFASVFSVGVEIPLSKGVIEEGGERVNENGSALITNLATSESYISPIIDGYFNIYSFFDEQGNAQPINITAYTAEKVGRVDVTLTEQRLLRVAVQDALIMATKRTSRVVSFDIPTATIDFNLGKCCYAEKVFASDDSEYWKNDKSSFLKKKVLITDTILFELQKNGIKVADLNDNTLGEYYEFDAKYVGFILNWQKVYLENGLGSYRVKTTKNIAGQAIEEFSQDFCLELYSDLAADKTVRIETYQTGTIERSGFNYDEIALELAGGWYQSYRIKGRLGNKTPTLEIDYLMTSNREMLQIQDKVSYEYTLETYPLPNSVAKILIEDNFLANEIYITDYNIYNTEVFRRVPLYVSAYSDTKHFSHNTDVIYNLTLKNRIDNIIKRN